jgi:hypothetical protein
MRCLIDGESWVPWHHLLAADLDSESVLTGAWLLNAASRGIPKQTRTTLRRKRRAASAYGGYAHPVGGLPEWPIGAVLKTAKAGPTPSSWVRIPCPPLRCTQERFPVAVILCALMYATRRCGGA